MVERKYNSFFFRQGKPVLDICFVCTRMIFVDIYLQMRYTDEEHTRSFQQGFYVGGGMNMARKRFVEAISQKVDFGYDRPDRIPGTDKIRTFCSNPWVYSKESSLEKITSKRLRITGEKEKKTAE